VGDRSIEDGLTRSGYTLAVQSSVLGLTPQSPPRILQARTIDATTIELLLSAELESAAVTYLLTIAATVTNAADHLIGVRVGLFHGLATERTVRGGQTASEVASMGDLRDFAFHPTPRSPGGSLATTADGDYAIETGPETLRKMIFRRLTTPTGGFAWLPDYGFDFGQSRLLRANDVDDIEADARRQILREPEVQDATIGVRHYVGQGVVFLDIDPVLRNGMDTGSISVPIIAGGAA